MFKYIENFQQMKNLLYILNVVALVGIVSASCNNANNKPTTAAGNDVQTTGAIAYVNIDTLQEYYQYFQDKKAELEAHQQSMSSELKRSQEKFQKDYLAAQRKAQAGTLTQAEYETTAKRLSKMQQSLEARDASLTEQLLKEQNDFNKDLKKRLDDYLVEYNKSENYDFILSYGEALPVILLANPTKDITREVLKGMNEEYEAQAATSEKKKDKK